MVIISAPQTLAQVNLSSEVRYILIPIGALVSCRGGALTAPTKSFQDRKPRGRINQVPAAALPALMAEWYRFTEKGEGMSFPAGDSGCGSRIGTNPHYRAVPVWGTLDRNQ